MRKFFWSVILGVFLLSFPLVLASSVTVDKGTYSLDEEVTVSVTGCPGSSFLTVLNPSGQAVFSDQGNGDWETVYHTSSEPSIGGYRINAFCGGESFFVNFNVGEEALAVEEEEIEEEVAEEEAPAADETRAQREGCTPDWSCGYWSFCDADLKQTRTCVDLNNCQAPKTEARDCLACAESWVCSLWSNCAAGKQTRKCYDEHSCGSMVKKPELQRFCDMPVTGPVPARIIQVPPEQFTIPTPEVEIPRPSFWEKYKLWLVVVPAVLILLSIAFFVYLRYFRASGETANITGLKNWVKKALEKGASKERIREIIHQQTNWADKELNQAFKELEEEKQPK